MRKLILLLVLLLPGLAHARTVYLSAGDEEIRYEQAGRRPTLTIDTVNVTDVSITVEKLSELPTELKKGLAGPVLAQSRKHLGELKKKVYEDFAWHGDLALPVEGEGVYLVRVDGGGGQVAERIVCVTRLLMEVELGPGHVLVYAFDTVRGVPAAGCDVSWQEGKTTRHVRTAADGVVMVPISTSGQWRMVGQLGNSLNAVEASHEPLDPNHLYVYTDRPVYRPGQTVSFKAIWRQRPYGHTTYENMANRAVEIKIRDSVGSLIYKREASTSAFGSVNGQYDLASEPALGAYSIEVLAGGKTMFGSFKVEEYRKPEFTVTVQGDKPYFMTGESVTATVNARYLFGTPVSGGKFTYRVYANAFTPPAVSEVAPEDRYLLHEDNSDGRVVDVSGEFVDRGEGTLDAAGVAHIKLPLRHSTGAVSLAFQVDVTDDANRTQSGTSSVLVAAQSFYLAASTDLALYQPGEKIHLDIRARDWSGKGRSLPVTVTLGQHVGEVFATASKVVVKTGADGSGHAVLKAPDIPTCSILVAAADPGRPPVSDEVGISVTSSKSSLATRWPDLEITTDRPVYSAGDNALVAFRTGVKTGHVLLVAECDDIFTWHVVPVHNHMAVVRLPLSAREAPTVHLQAVLAYSAGMYQARAVLSVRPHSHLIDVGVSLDKTEARPGDTETVTLTTRDPQGHPVPAEVSLAVVDEAIFAIMGEVAMPIQQFFWGFRDNQVATFLSPVPVYSAGSFQKVGKDVKIRKKFLDTAQWSPSLETGKDGKLTLKVPLPDNLTTWRFTATAVSKVTQVGATRTTALVRKPFMIRVIVPRFMTRSDSSTVLTQVINETGAAQDVTVRIKIENLKLTGSDTWKGKMTSGETKTLKWAVTHDASLPPTVTAVATTASGVSDGEEQSMGAVPWGAPQTTGSSGFLKAGSTVESSLTMPADFDKTAGGLKIHLSPGIPGVVAASLSSQGVGSSTDEIADGVYLAAQVVDAVKHHGVVIPLSGAAVLRDVQERIPVLYERQTSEGGWSWTGEGAPDIYISAQVLEALAAARRAGFLVDDDKLNRGAEFLLGRLAPKENLGEAVTLAHAIVTVKPIPGESLDWFYQHRQELDYQGQANLIDILVASKQDGKARTAVLELVKAATRSQDQAHWETAPEKYDWDSDSIVASAHAMEAICRVEAQNDVLEPALRWLLMRRSVDGWGTEGETTAVCDALLRWMASHGEKGGPMEVDLLANGQKLGHWTIETGDPQGRERVATIRPSQLRPGVNKLALVATGKGSVLYFWQSDVYPMSQEPMPPSDHGLAVNRQYFRRIFNYDSKGQLSYRFEPLHGSVKVGDQVLVVVKFASWHSSKYLELEDPLPSGFDASEQDEASLYPTGYQHDYISRVWFRDQKVVMYQDHAEPRIYLYTYMMRATTPGHYSINPATVKLAYYPEVCGNSSSGTLDVQP